MHYDIWKFGILIAIAGIMGLVLGNPLICMLIASIGIIAWQILQSRRLYKWVVNPRENAMLDTDGQAYLLHREINRREMAHRRERRQRNKFISEVRKAIGALPDAVVLINDNGKIEWANSHAKTVLGIKWPTDAKVRFTDLIRYPEIDALLNRKTQSDQGIEINSKYNRGQTINVKCIRYTNNLRMIVARDVSRLIKVNQMHADFVANVSHELKTPLTVLRGYLEILQDNNTLPDSLIKPIKQMSVQSARMQFIVNDLLYLAKLEDTENIKTREPVDITHVVNTIVESVQPLIEEKKHKLELDIDYDLKIVGAQTELHSAFNNLISNAIHYTPENGLIQVRWRSDENGATFSVKDNGLGIPEQHLRRLTRRFYRVDTDRSRDGGGTGLGLAIVKHVLQRHNAILEINSTEDIGSEFICRFPAETIGDQIPSAPAVSNDE